jgi:glutaredoxin 3
MVSISEVLKTSPTFLVVLDRCPWCSKAEALLDEHGVKYGKYNKEDNVDLVAEIQSTTGRRKFPMIYTNGRFLGGYDELLLYFKNEPQYQNVL